jgi:hypothetical protein
MISPGARMVLSGKTSLILGKETMRLSSAGIIGRVVGF